MVDINEMLKNVKKRERLNNTNTWRLMTYCELFLKDFFSCEFYTTSEHVEITTFTRMSVSKHKNAHTFKYTFAEMEEVNITALFIDLCEKLTVEFPKFRGHHASAIRNIYPYYKLKTSDKLLENIPEQFRDEFSAEKFSELVSSETSEYILKDKALDFQNFGTELVENAQLGRMVAGNHFISNLDAKSESYDYLYFNYIKALKMNKKQVSYLELNETEAVAIDYDRYYQNFAEINLVVLNLSGINKQIERKALEKVFKGATKYNTKIVVFSKFPVKKLYSDAVDESLVMYKAIDADYLVHHGIVRSAYELK